MRYTNPELIDKLAAEYVLGTLHGSARKRFERLSLSIPLIRERITYWEENLLPLHEEINSVTPSNKVWRHIKDRILPRSNPPVSFWGNVRTWRSVSFAMSLIIALVVVNIYTVKPVTEPIAQYITVLATENSQAAWIVRMYTETGNITVQALKTNEPGLKKVFELWMLPDGGVPPKSLGLMPVSGEKSLSMSVPLLQTLFNTKALAVSLEPAGGSPTGLPTGDVLYTGKLNSI